MKSQIHVAYMQVSRNNISNPPIMRSPFRTSVSVRINLNVWNYPTRANVSTWIVR